MKTRKQYKERLDCLKEERRYMTFRMRGADQELKKLYEEYCDRLTKQIMKLEERMEELA